jgi:hypothetical protein
VAFREVGVHEIKEVLRLWLRGEGLRSIARLARVDRSTVVLCTSHRHRLLSAGTRWTRSRVDLPGI